MSVGPKILLIAALTGAAQGCVEMHPTRSGFLSDYSELRQVGHHRHVLANPVDMDALAEMDSFYIEPVEWLADNLGQPASNIHQADRIRHTLEEALVRRLGEILPLVGEDQIGPRTAVVRAAVTGVQESKPWANAAVITQVGPLFNGGASAEIEVLAPNGCQIAAQSVAYRGHEWELFGFFIKRAHAETAMRRAAKQLSRDLTADTSPETDEL